MAVFFLTTTGTSTIGAALPANFPGAADKIECIGSGGNGVAATTGRSGAGGAGGSYASATSADGVLSLSSSTSFTIGAAGSSSNTTITAGSVVITAPFGANGSTTVGGTPGAAGTPHGFAGGAGGAGSATALTPGGGGGGAGGPIAAGAKGGDAAGTGSYGGSGGGGDGNAASPTAGGTASSTVGGSAGTPNGGAGGAGRTTSGTATTGARSTAALNWDASHGISGGGGGGGSNNVGSGTRVGGAGGAGNPASGFGFGGGGGGGGSAGVTGGGLGAGTQGLIVVTYTPNPVFASATQAAVASVNPPFTGIIARQPTRFAGAGAIYAIATMPHVVQKYQGNAVYSGIGQFIGQPYRRAQASAPGFSGLASLFGSAIPVHPGRAALSASATTVGLAVAGRTARGSVVGTATVAGTVVVGQQGRGAFSAVASFVGKATAARLAVPAPLAAVASLRGAAAGARPTRALLSAAASLVASATTHTIQQRWQATFIASAAGVIAVGSKYRLSGVGTFSAASSSFIPELWSSSHKDANISGGETTTATKNMSDFAVVYGSRGQTNGKRYLEIALSDINDGIGIGNILSPVTDGTFLGADSSSVGIYWNGPATGYTGFMVNGTWFAETVNVGWNSGDHVGIALDLDNKLLWVKNVTQNSFWWGSDALVPGDPVAGTHGFDLTGAAFSDSFTITQNPVVPGASIYYAGNTAIGYFGQASWLGAPPAGFVTLDIPVAGAGISGRAIAGRPARTGFSGSASLSAAARPRRSGRVPFSAIGSTQAIAIASRAARGILSGAAVLTSTITANRVGRAAVSGNARFVGRATVLPPVRVGISGTASLRATATRVVIDYPSISATGSLVARARVIARPLPSFSAAGTLYGRSRYRASISVGISGTATFLANADALRRTQQFASARFSGAASVQLYPTGIDAREPTNYAGAGSLQGRVNVARQVSTSIAGAGSLVVQTQIAYPVAQQYQASATFGGAANALFYDPLLYVIVDPPQPIIPNTTPLGTIVANLTGVRTDGKAFAGNFIFVAPNWDDPPLHVNGPGAGVYAITQAGGFGSQGELVINPNGPGVGAAGGSIEHVTIIAADPPVPQVAAVSGAAAFTARVLPYAFTRVRISAVAAVTAPAALRAGAVASWFAAGVMTSRVSRAMFGTATIYGTANIVGHAGILPRSVSAVVSAAGAFSGRGALGLPTRGQLSGTAAFAARAAAQRPTSGSFSASATASVSARIRLRARTSVSGTASLYADSTPRFRQAQQYPALASLAGAGQLAALGARQQKIFSALAVFSGTAGSFYYDPLLYVVVSPTSWTSAPLGATVALLTGIRTDGHPFHGNFTFAAPKWDNTGSHIVGSGVGVYAITQSGGPGTQGSLIVNPNGPGLAAGGSVADITIVANDPVQPQVAGVAGTAVFSATSRRGLAAKTGISGVSAFSATVIAERVATVSFAAFGSFQAASLRRLRATTAFSGTAALATAAVVAPKSVSGAFAAVGMTLGRARLGLRALTALSGAGVFTAIAGKVVPSTAAFSASASASGRARVRMPARTQISGAAAFAAVATRLLRVPVQYPDSALFSAPGQFSANAIRLPKKSFLANATFSGSGSAVFYDPLLWLEVQPPNPVIPSNTALGAIVANLIGHRTDGHPFAGNFTFAPPNWDDPPLHVAGPGAGVYAITQSAPGAQGALIINPTGLGVGAAGGSIEHVTLVTNDPPVSQVAGIAGAGTFTAQAVRFLAPTRVRMLASGVLAARAVPQRYTTARFAAAAALLANSDRFIKGAWFASAIITAAAAFGAAVQIGSRPRVQLSGNARLIGVAIRGPKGGRFALASISGEASLRVFPTGIRARQPTRFTGVGSLVVQARNRLVQAQAALAGSGTIALQHKYRANARGAFSGAASLVSQATTKHITITYPGRAAFAAAASVSLPIPFIYITFSPSSWSSAPLGGTVSTMTAYRSDGHTFRGNFTFAAPKWDATAANIEGAGAGIYAITQGAGPGTPGTLVVNPTGPGLSTGGSIADITVIANDPVQPQDAAAIGAATIRARAIVGYAARLSASAMASFTVTTKQRYAGVTGFSGTATLVGSATTVVKPPPGAQFGNATAAAVGTIVARARYLALPTPILSGAGSLQATVKFYRAAGLATLSGAATVSAAVTGSFRPTARLSAPANLMVAPRGVGRISANLSGAAVLSGSALPAHHIRPGLSAVAALRASVPVSARPRVRLAGAASISMRHTAVTYPLTSFAAAGNLRAEASRLGIIFPTLPANFAAEAMLSARVNVEMMPHYAIVSAAATIRTTARVRLRARVRFAGGGSLSAKVNVISTSKARFAGGGAVTEIIRHAYTYYPLLDTGLPQRSPQGVYAYGYNGIAITADPLETSYLVVWLAFDRVVTNIQCVWDPLGANQAMTQETSDLPFGLATSATFWLFLPEPGVQTLEVSWNGSAAQVQVNAATYGRTLYGRVTTQQQTDFVNYNVGQLMNKHR